MRGGKGRGRRAGGGDPRARRCSGAGVPRCRSSLSLLGSVRLACPGARSLLRWDWTQETRGRPALFLKSSHAGSRGAARACPSAPRGGRAGCCLSRENGPRPTLCRRSHAPRPPRALPPRLPPRAAQAAQTVPGRPRCAFPLQDPNLPAGIPVSTRALRGARNTSAVGSADPPFVQLLIERWAMSPG